MNLTTPEIAVVGACVIPREEWKSPLDAMNPIAEFSSYTAAVQAIRLLRRDDWLIAAELTLDDEDFLTMQVLVRRLKKRVAGKKVSKPTQLFSGVQTDKTEGVTLEDLL